MEVELLPAWTGEGAHPHTSKLYLTTPSIGELAVA